MDEQNGIFLVLVLLFGIGCLFFGLAKINKGNLKQEYEFETYYDQDSGITMRIFKDGLGDVLWCEPIETEMEVK